VFRQGGWLFSVVLVGALLAVSGRPAIADDPAPSEAAPVVAPCQEYIDLLNPERSTATEVALARQLGFPGDRNPSRDDVMWKLGFADHGRQCRQAIEQGTAAVFMRATGSARAEEVGAVVCAIHPRTAWAISWMIGVGCVAGLAEVYDQPEAKKTVDAALAQALKRNPYPDAHESGWEVETFHAERSPGLRALLAPLLPRAHQVRAKGYDSLWDLECTNKRGPSPVSAERCAELEGNEVEWAKTRVRGEKLAGTALFVGPAVGAVALVAANPSDSSSRGLAAGSLAVGTGFAVGALIDHAFDQGPDHFGLNAFFGRLFGVLGGIGAGVVAGIVSYDNLGGTSGRVAVTAAGAALFSLTGLTLVWDGPR
jgi:hypothetical protein